MAKDYTMQIAMGIIFLAYLSLVLHIPTLFSTLFSTLLSKIAAVLSLFLFLVFTIINVFDNEKRGISNNG